MPSCSVCRPSAARALIALDWLDLLFLRIPHWRWQAQPTSLPDTIANIGVRIASLLGTLCATAAPPASVGAGHLQQPSPAARLNPLQVVVTTRPDPAVLAALRGQWGVRMVPLTEPALFRVEVHDGGTSREQQPGGPASTRSKVLAALCCRRCRGRRRRCPQRWRRWQLTWRNSSGTNKPSREQPEPRRVLRREAALLRLRTCSLLRRRTPAAEQRATETAQSIWSTSSLTLPSSGTHSRLREDTNTTAVLHAIAAAREPLSVAMLDVMGLRDSLERLPGWGTLFQVRIIGTIWRATRWIQMLE